jgi:hypothetical protein
MPFIESTDNLQRSPSGVTPPDPLDPSLGQTIGAAFGQDNTIVNLYRRLREEQFPPEPGHNPLDTIRGTDYEAFHLDRFIASGSPAEDAQIKRRIDEENEDRKVLAASGVAGFVAQVAAGAADPTLALPGVVGVRLARGGYSVARTALATAGATAAQTAAQEAVLQGTQETRTAGESVVSIASATLIGGLIGSGAASLLSRAERSALEKALDADRAVIDAHAAGQAMPAPAGAAASDTRQLELFRTPLDALGLDNLSVTRRTMNAASTQARREMADLSEMPYRFRENEEGIATTQGPAVDRLARMEINGQRAVIGDELDRLFSEYRFGQDDMSVPRLRARIEDFSGSGEGKMPYADFKREVAVAMQQGDQHAIPQVAAAAQFIRQRVFDPWVARAEGAVEGFQRMEPGQGESYFPHVWNKEIIKAKRPEFTNRLVDLYRKDQDTKRGIQQRLEWANTQLQTWSKQIAKLEARLARAEAKADDLDARAAERSRDDRPKTVGLNDPDPTGRVADLQRRRAELAEDAKDLSESIDLMKELANAPNIPEIIRRTVAQLERRTITQRVEGARFSEAARNAKMSEKRLAVLEEQLGKTEARKALIEEYLVVAAQIRDAVRAKIEADLAAWEGKSATEAKAAMKVREAADAARSPEAKAAKPRLEGADDAVDRVVKRILASDRELGIDELRARAQQTVDRILGSPDGRLPYDMHMGGPRIGATDGSPPRGALAERALNVSNAWARDFIENDIEQVVAMHLRTMVPDVLLSERFGDVEMTQAFRRVNESYAQMIDQTRSAKERTRLGKERDAVIRDLAAVRDRVRGVYGWSPELQNMARVANAAKAVNNLSSMGVSAISSLPDLAGAVFRYGLTSTFRDGWSPFFRNMVGATDEWKKFKSQMRAIGIGIETAINARQHALDDVADVYRPQSRVERVLQGASDKFFIANLMAPLTDAQKLIASHVAVSEILRATKAVAAGKATKKQIGNLAETGIDQQMAGRIWAQFQTGGESRGGVHLPNTGDWTDKAAAEALNGAVAREVDIMVVTPGQEKPLWMSKPVVSLLGQFKSFTASATERILVANMQRRDAAALSGIIFSLGLGMLSYKLNSFFGGMQTSDRPQDWVKEGVSRAGLLGWFEDGNALATKATRGSVDVYRLIGAEKPLSRFASRSAADMLLGPTWGKIESLPTITGAMASGEWGAADTSAVRRLLPFQNMFWLRGALNQVEAATNGAFGVPERKAPN